MQNLTAELRNPNWDVILKQSRTHNNSLYLTQCARHAAFFGILHICNVCTFQDELQYIFLKKNIIFMIFLAVKDAGTDVV